MINRAINKVLLWPVLLLLLNNITAMAGEINPRDIVERYYIADLNGVRLSGKTYKSIKHLITWEHEPGWDYAFVVDKIKITNVDKISNGEVCVEVRYHVIGIIGWQDFAEYDFNEVIDYSLVLDGNQWKIKSPVFPPHISPASAIKNLEELISNEGVSDEEIKKFSLVVERLKEIQ